jgi:hypothetical protein
VSRAIALKAALVLAGLAGPLLLVELALRLFGPVLPGNYETGVWAEGHPVVGHAHIPGARAWVREPEFTTFLRFNQHGLRGADVRVPKPPDRFRVLLVGDSFIEGKQVAEAETVGEQINALMTQADRQDVRALNAGVFDWSQVHEYLYIREVAPALQPDLIVQFLYVGNDIGDIWPRARSELRDLERPMAVLDDGEVRFLPWRRRQVSADEWLLNQLSRRSTAWRAFETGVVDKLRYRDRDGAGVEGQMLELFRFKESPAEARAWQTAEALLVSTRDAAAEVGAQYAVVVIPTRWQVHEDDWKALLAARDEPDDDRWVLRGPQRRLVQLAERHQIPALDLLPPLREAAQQGSRLYYQTDIHWNAQGHQLAASAVADFLQRSDLLSRPRTASSPTDTQGSVEVGRP